MFNQTTPQDYLNDMHAIGIPRLFRPKLNPRDRATGIQSAKKELGRLQVELQHHRDALRNKHKKAPAPEVKNVLAPFNLLQNLIQQLHDEVTGLEDKLASGKMLPHGFEFGQYIFGDEAQGDWFIGDQVQYDEWLEAEDVRQRMLGFRQDGQPLLDRLAKVQTEFGQLKAVYQSEQKKLDKHQKRGYILRRILLLLLLTIMSASAGAYVLIEMGSQLGLIGFGVAGFFFLLIPFAYRDWKRRNAKLVATVREYKTQLRRLQLHGQEIKKKYRPIEFQIKSLDAQYRKLRAGLSGGKQVTSVA